MPAPRRSAFPWKSVGVLVVVAGVGIVFFCSGIPLPIMGGALNDLNRKLNLDFGLEIPALGIVEHGARSAKRDSAYYFVIALPPNDAEAFVRQLRKSASAKKMQVDDAQVRYPMGPEPDWFTPSQHADVATFSIIPRNDDHSWRCCFSPSTGKLYVEYLTH